jgi:transposase, IS6 family
VLQKRKLICYSGEKRAKEVFIMSDQSQYPFKWRHFQADIILLCVRWYLRYALSYRDLARDDGGARFARGSYHDLPLGSALCSWAGTTLPSPCEVHDRFVAGRWDLHQGEKAMDVSLPGRRFGGKHARFLFERDERCDSRQRVLAQNAHCLSYKLATSHRALDKNAAYPKAFNELKAAGIISKSCTLRQVKYRGNLIEQDHRFIKRLTKPGMGFFSLETAWRTLQGFEVMNMIRKGQLQGVVKGDVRGQVALVATLFGVTV